MKKGFYLVVAFLLGGTTLTLNSCIDTTEPAGIEAMRNAKAEYLNALAQFRSAKAMLEMIEVQKAQIDLELKRLQFEIDKIQKEAEKYAKMAERDQAILDFHKKRAEAEKNYIDAIIRIKVAMINLKDNVVAEEIDKIKDELEKEFGNLNTLQANLTKEQITKWQVETDKNEFLETLALTQAEKEKELAILNDYIVKLDSLDNLNFSDKSAIENQIEAYNKQLDALLKKEHDAMVEVLAMKKYPKATAEEITNLEKQKKEAKLFTIAKKDVKETMQELLSQQIAGMSLTSITPAGAATPTPYDIAHNADEAFDNNDQMVADFVIEDVKLEDYDQLNTLVIDVIEAAYQQAYTARFLALTGASPADLFDEDGNVKAAYAAQVAAELERLKLDENNIKTAYTEKAAEWVEKYNAYSNALKSFGAYNGTNNDSKYQNVVKNIEIFLELEAADQSLSKAKKRRDEIIKFVNDKKNIDGLGETSDFATFNNNFGIDANTSIDKLDNTTLNSFIAQLEAYKTLGNYSSLLGAKAPASSYASYSDVVAAASTKDKQGGALADFLVATYELFNVQITDIKEAYVPVSNKVPEIDVTTVPGSLYAKYYNIMNPVDNNIINDVKSWAALVEKMKAQTKEAEDALKVINDKIDELKKKHQGEELWKKELAIYMINGNSTVTVNGVAENVFSTENPYSSIASLGGIVTEKSKIEDLIVLATYVKNNNKFPKYTYWDDNTGSYRTVSSDTDLATQIKQVKKDIVALKADLETINNILKAAEEFGAYAAAGTALDNYLKEIKFISTIEQNIEKFERQIAAKEELIERYKTAINNIIEAYEAGNIDAEIPELPGIDTDEPEAEEPETDEPVEDEPVEDEPAEDEPAEDEPAEDEPAEDEPAEDEENSEEEEEA